jgi:hypothetical protein
MLWRRYALICGFIVSELSLVLWPLSIRFSSCSAQYNTTRRIKHIWKVSCKTCPLALAIPRFVLDIFYVTPKGLTSGDHVGFDKVLSKILRRSEPKNWISKHTNRIRNAKRKGNSSAAALEAPHSAGRCATLAQAVIN